MIKKAAFIFLVVFVSCNPADLYDPVVIEEQFYATEEGWMYSDSIAFEVDIKDVEHTYNIWLTIRHDRSYPYRNLWVGLSEIGPEGEHRFRRYELDFSTPAGVWFGTQTGNFVDQRTRIRRHTRFEKPGTYTFYLSHNMRDDLLTEVQNAGIRIEKNR